MNKQKWILLLVALAVIGGGSATLSRMKTNQRLGEPGIKSEPIANSQRRDIYLPKQVLDYTSQVIPVDTNVLEGLPHDTSFAFRNYIPQDAKSFLDCLQFNVVLMGTDRTSIHKPEFCLSGSGWDISDAESSTDKVRVNLPQPYDLPIMKLVTTKAIKMKTGEEVTLRGIYVYWFVADHELTERHWVRMREMSTHLLATGELQRWAYVSCFARCLPGDEARTYERMKKFIAASVPEFQRTTGAPVATGASPQQTALN